MAQPQVGYQWTSISAGAGTAVITPRTTTLVRLVIPGTYTGTINFHDAASAAGTTSTSSILILGLPNTSVGGHIEVGANCRKGLVYEATGTPVLTAIWE